MFIFVLNCHVTRYFCHSNMSFCIIGNFYNFAYKKPSYRWGTARRGRASWNLV